MSINLKHTFYFIVKYHNFLIKALYSNANELCHLAKAPRPQGGSSGLLQDETGVEMGDKAEEGVDSVRYIQNCGDGLRKV